jgi:hypothetical protein
MWIRCAGAALTVFLVSAGMTGVAFAQARPAPAFEVPIGYAGFADEGVVGHFALGAAGRFYLTPRIGVGPEIVYLDGPGDDRDLVLTGNLTFDFLPPAPGRRVIPFVVAGGGLFQHRDQFFDESVTSTEGSFTGGGGVRMWLSERVYLAPEFRVGWEPHYRVTVAVGATLGR